MRITVEIPGSMKQRLKKVANRSGRSAVDVARDAVMEYVEDAEDIYESERILRRVRSGRERTFTLDAVSRKLRI